MVEVSSFFPLDLRFLNPNSLFDCALAHCHTGLLVSLCGTFGLRIQEMNSLRVLKMPKGQKRRRM